MTKDESLNRKRGRKMRNVKNSDMLENDVGFYYYGFGDMSYRPAIRVENVYENEIELRFDIGVGDIVKLDEYEDGVSKISIKEFTGPKILILEVAYVRIPTETKKVEIYDLQPYGPQDEEFEALFNREKRETGT